jgi:hypothetical protein
MRFGTAARWAEAALAFALAGAALSACGGSTPPTTTAVSQQPATAIWPYYGDGVRYVTPVAAAKGFAVSMLGMVDPAASAYSGRTSHAGLVDVTPPGGGTPTVVRVSQLADTTWWVTSSTFAEATISSPAAGGTVTSPLTVTGTSVAYEAVANVSLFANGMPTPLATATVMGGSTSPMAYRGQVTFTSPAHGYGVLVVYTKTAKDGSTVGGTAQRVNF